MKRKSSRIPEKLSKMLEENDFVLVREAKHMIFKHKPSGRVYPLSRGRSYDGPSRTLQNTIGGLRKFLKTNGYGCKE